MYVDTRVQVFGHQRKVLISVPRERYKGPGKHTRGERSMTNTSRMYGIEGSSALVASYPTLTLLEGGAGHGATGRARRPRGAAMARQRASRGDVLAVAACTLAVALGLLAALVAGNASVSERMDAALSSLPAQQIVVEPGDSVWGLASRHRVDGYSTAELAKWISEKNSLGTSSLRPGQALLVPASR